jgi:hypothetical protein
MSGEDLKRALYEFEKVLREQLDRAEKIRRDEGFINYSILDRL